MRRLAIAMSIALCPLGAIAGAQEPTAPAPQVPPEDATRPTQTVVGFDYSLQHFLGDLDPWQVGSVSVGRRGAFGSLAGRVNVARRFAQTGWQGELDAYPRITRSTYVYLNAGYSGADIFPSWRFGAEVFRSLPGAWEASAGLRQLRFEGSPVTLLTGTVGRYVGNYWVSLRPYLRERTDGWSTSGSLQARRYFEDGDNYIGARIGLGTTPSDELHQGQITRMNSFTAGLQGSRTVRRNTLATWSAGYDREELAVANVRTSLTGSFGLRVMR